jgi:hypothetical protein
MRDLVRTRAWWSKLDQDIQEFVKSCPNCQIAQRQRSGQEREYGQLPTSRYIEPFQRWGIDLIGRLPRTKEGNCWIITAIDYATGWPIAKAVKDATKETIAEFIFHATCIMEHHRRSLQMEERISGVMSSRNI